MLPTANTGLIDPSTVFWGNKIGDSGTTSPAGSFETTSTDAAQVFATIGGGKSVIDRHDYNRDGQVTSTDAAIVFANVGHITRLNIGAAGPFAPDAEPVFEVPSDYSPLAPASDADDAPAAANQIAAALTTPLRAVVGVPAVAAGAARLSAGGSDGRNLERPHQELSGGAFHYKENSRAIAISTHASEFLAGHTTLDDELLDQLLADLRR
jgi:hypothetical protein